MGRLFVISLEGRFYSCKHCHTHIGLSEDILSKSFNWMNGKAYLFKEVVNVTFGEQEDRMMLSGMFTVADIFCVGCSSLLGWRYEHAHIESQKYKEGKFLLGRCKLSGPGRNQPAHQEVEAGGGDTEDA